MNVVCLSASPSPRPPPPYTQLIHGSHKAARGRGGGQFSLLVVALLMLQLGPQDTNKMTMTSPPSKTETPTHTIWYMPPNRNINQKIYIYPFQPSKRLHAPGPPAQLIAPRRKGTSAGAAAARCVCFFPTATTRVLSALHGLVLPIPSIPPTQGKTRGHPCPTYFCVRNNSDTVVDRALARPPHTFTIRRQIRD